MAELWKVSLATPPLSHNIKTNKLNLSLLYFHVAIVTNLFWEKRLQFNNRQWYNKNRKYKTFKQLCPSYYVKY